MQFSHDDPRREVSHAETQYSTLKFATFTTEIEVSFYASLASHKINNDKLDDSTRRVVGLYEIRPSEVPAVSCRMQIRGNALTSDEVSSGCYRAEGTLKNYNTVEEYRASEKGTLLDRAARTIWDAIGDGTIFSCPSLLASFHLLFFSDLKKYKFTYLCGYPAFHSEPSWKLLPYSSVEKVVIGRLTATESTDLVEKVQTWRYRTDARQWGFFLAKRALQRGQSPAATIPGGELEAEPSLQSNWDVESLSAYEDGFFKEVPDSDRFICFADPSTYEEHPGWPLRNLLALARRRWNLDHLQVICYRDTHAKRHEARSILLNLKCVGDTSGLIDKATMPKVTGWERSSSGKVVSKVTNLGDYLDPRKLADQAVDLNLKLIKWRLAPTLDLEIIKKTRCLLLGSGTLGSYVSRNLMGWGVRTITLIDNGTVSFSNPVRQPLFNFEDCLGGGVAKAERAATALKEIYPGVNANGFNMSVPMLGHAMLDEDKTKADFENLNKLFSEHDVVFLLMDTRESRWLPTVMGKAMGKLVMNAALGFDNYVVMRHGGPDIENPGQELGCYFCNDVVTPADSMSDRTLDQQCTVTRPGVAAIASALLVELMVSVLQDSSRDRSSTIPLSEHPLGDVPHTIRGYLSRWNTLNIVGKSYDQCSACSQAIIREFQARGWGFVKQALVEKDYVAELSGLADLQRRTELLAADVEWDEDGGDMADTLDEEGELL